MRIPWRTRSTSTTWAARTDTSAAEIAEWLEPANRPEVLRDLPRHELTGVDPDDCRGLLVGLFAEELARLRDLEQRVRREVDEPRWVAALQRASILSDEAARRVTRSHAESRTTFHRALKDLFRTLDRDEEQGPPEHADDEDDHDETGDEPVAGVDEAEEPTSEGDEGDSTGEDQPLRDTPHGLKTGGFSVGPGG